MPTAWLGSSSPIPPGATITTARALVGSSLGGAGTVQTNMAVYGRALNGTLKNYAFYGDGGTLFNLDPILAGSEVNQSAAAIAARRTGNGLEFGHTDAGGYGSTIGATHDTGFPFVALCAEADPTGDTFRTRGFVGWSMLTPLNGELRFVQYDNANAAGQAGAVQARFRASGNLELFEMPIIPTHTPRRRARPAALARSAGTPASFTFAPRPTPGSALRWRLGSR
jgi:hypothetical protein